MASRATVEQRAQCFDRIRAALEGHAEQHRFRILGASEFGSGCNNLHAPDSDFDLSFVFVRQLSAYFAIDPATTDKGGDTFRIQGLRIPASASASSSDDQQHWLDVDAQGYDVPLALKMLRDGNLNMLDWLYCSAAIIGGERDQATDRATRALFNGAKAIVALAPAAAIKALAHQLFSKAKNHDVKFFGGRFSKSAAASPPPPCLCLHKKYFYVVVPLLRLLWLQSACVAASFASFALPPHDIAELLDFAHAHGFSCPAALTELVARKRQGLLSEEPAPCLTELDPWLARLFAHVEPFLQQANQAAMAGTQPKALGADWDRLWFDVALASAGLDADALC